ncbi:MAG: four helix bundle protein [Bacteroidota bacterium]
MKIRKHQDLVVFQLAFDSAMEIFEISKKFPKNETYSLTDQIRRSSRSVAANLAESFRKRRYKAHFIAKLSDSEMEAAETQVWLKFALKCKYIDGQLFQELDNKYDRIIRMLVTMSRQADKWTL